MNVVTEITGKIYRLQFGKYIQPSIDLDLFSKNMCLDYLFKIYSFYKFFRKDV